MEARSRKGRCAVAGKNAKKAPPKTRGKVKEGRRTKVAKNTIALIGKALGIEKMDGAVIQDCLFRVSEDKAPVCVLIQELEFRQVGSLLVIQPKPTSTIEAVMGHLPSE